MNSKVEKMKQYFDRKWVRLLMVPTLALALGGSLAAYKFGTPASASAAMAAPPAAPLDAESVSPLIALNHAMETLAAHVTPAVVNVTVTSRAKQDASEGQLPEGMEQFFGQFFGQQGGQGMQSQPRIEHGIGSGVIISPDGYIVTNNHVVEGATEIKVTLSDRRILTAKVVGTDPLDRPGGHQGRCHESSQRSYWRLVGVTPRTDRARLRQSLRLPLYGDSRDCQRAESPQSLQR